MKLAFVASLLLGLTTASYSSVCFLGPGWQGCQFSNAPLISGADPVSNLWGSMLWGTGEWSE